MADLARHVPEKLRGRFVAAYEGQYGCWFEFDGSVRFRDAGGLELYFAYGATLAECRKMMKRHSICDGTAAPAGVGKAGKSSRRTRR